MPYSNYYILWHPLHCNGQSGGCRRGLSGSIPDCCLYIEKCIQQVTTALITLSNSLMMLTVLSKDGFLIV